MIALLLAILTSTTVLLLFKVISQKQVNLFHAVVVNYIVSFFIGAFMVRDNVLPNEILKESWLPWAIFLGIIFITMFYLIGLCTRNSGMTATAVAHKLSLVIPVAVGMFLYDEKMHLLKALAIILAMLSVYYASVKKKDELTISGFNHLILPFIVFLGSGIVDSLIKHVEVSVLPKESYHHFLTTLFFTSSLAGILVLAAQRIVNKEPFQFPTLLWGLLLGIFNYGAVFFIVKALNDISFDKSIVFPINNIGVVSLSAIAAVLIFKEPLNRKNILGIAMAFTAIVLLTYEMW